MVKKMKGGCSDCKKEGGVIPIGLMMTALPILSRLFGSGLTTKKDLETSLGSGMLVGGGKSKSKSMKVKGSAINVGGATKKTNPWLSHVASVRRQHPNLSYKDVLVKAKSTYKKQSVKKTVSRKLKLGGSVSIGGGLEGLLEENL